MAQRHFLLLMMWSGLFVLAIIGLIVGDNDALLGLPYLVTPFVALVAFVRVFRRNAREPLSRRGVIAHRIACGLCVVFALGGVVGSAARFVDVGGTKMFQNGPIALLFLLSLVTSYHALVRPTPRHTALPAVIVHILWIPLLFANLAYYKPAEMTEWQEGLTGLGLLGLLGASAIASMVALAAFAGEPARVPEARQLPDRD